MQAGAGAGSTALQIEGPIKVSGTAPAFRHVPIAVAYVAPRWRIVTQNGSAMPAGAEFNVLVIKR